MSTSPLRPVSEADVIAKIGDAIRGSLIANKLKHIPRLIRSVAQQVVGQGGRFYIRNFWNDPDRLSLGYVGVHVKICMPLPNRANKYILMEVQVHPKQIMDGTEDCAKEIAHRLYKVPEETAKGKTSPDIVISSSQLIYLTSMTKLFYTKERVEGIAEAVRIMQVMSKVDPTTKEGKKMRLVYETMSLLEKAELGDPQWNEELQAVVPKARKVVATEWAKIAHKVNGRLDIEEEFPTAKNDQDSPWINTATSIESLLADATQMGPWFKTMCEQAARAADSKGGCYANFGPENRHMIKEAKSLRDKINKDRSRPPLPPPSGPPSSTGLPPNEAYLDLLLHLLENASVQSIPSLVGILDHQRKELIRQDLSELTLKQTKSYQLVRQLLFGQTVRSVVVESLYELHAEEQKNPPAVSPAAISSQHASVAPTLPSIAFGADEWRKYFGDVGDEPPLPPNIEQILSNPCPFFLGRAIRETHLLTLIPRAVNGKPFTLDSLGELVKQPKQGPAAQYGYYWENIQKQYGGASISASYWALVTRNVIPGSRGKSYEVQEQLIVDHSRKTGMPYKVPTLLEAAAAIFVAHVQTGTWLYGENLVTFTRCQERVSTFGFSTWPLVVGGGYAHSARCTVTVSNLLAHESYGVSGAQRVS